jgi:flagellar protein FlaJ
MIEELKKIAEQEIEILREILIFIRRAEEAGPDEKRMLEKSVEALRFQMKKINGMIPGLVAEISLEEKAPAAMPKIEEGKKQVQAGIAEKTAANRRQIMEELEISEHLIKRFKRGRGKTEEEKPEEFRKARGYLKLSNKIFLNFSKELIRKGYFASLPSEIKKSNIDILFEAYIAMILFSSSISLFVALAAVIALIYFGMSTIAWIPIFIPPIVFFALYFYPSAEKSSISKKINEELPFAAIHMSAISGSGIEPTEIFKIIGMSKEYPFLRKEIRKVLNQINIYGYDLVTALNNISKTTSSQKLAELFNGLSATINSGGNLSDFFRKRADTLIANYKLEKEKFIKVAETFMDIYIAVVIAAPMILMLLLVMISISGIQTGFTPQELTIITISGVALINIIFLVFLQAKQTS